MSELCLNLFNESAMLGQEPDLVVLVDAAADAGFAWVGLDVMSLDDWQRRGQAVGTVRDRLDARGVRCWEMTGINVGDRDDTLARTARVVAQAEVLEPQWILTNFAVPFDDRSLTTLLHACDALDTVGVAPAIEYLPWTPVNSAAAALEVVERLGDRRAGVLPDVWHHRRGPDTDADLAALLVERIAYVQVDDALPAGSDDMIHETLHRRVFPGDGELDVAGWWQVLRSIGFDGVVSIEVLDAQRRGGDAGAFAREAFAATRRCCPD